MAIPLPHKFKQLKQYNKDLQNIITKINSLNKDLEEIGWLTDNIQYRLPVYDHLAKEYDNYRLGSIVLGHLSLDLIHNVNLTG